MSEDLFSPRDLQQMAAMGLGTNIVRKELGLPEAECLAAEQRYSLTKSV